MTHALIYRNPGGNGYLAKTCHLEEQPDGVKMFVTREGVSTRREYQYNSVLERLGSTCAEADVELGELGELLKSRWLKRLEARLAVVLDAPEFEIETIGKVVGRQLHLELSRAGHSDHYKFCSDLLKRPVTSLALLTLEEAVAVRDALTADENAYLERHYIPEVTLTNPVHKPMRISLDPNQSGIGARARRGLGL